MLKFVKYVSCFTIPYDMQDKQRFLRMFVPLINHYQHASPRHLYHYNNTSERSEYSTSVDSCNNPCFLTDFNINSIKILNDKFKHRVNSFLISIFPTISTVFNSHIYFKWQRAAKVVIKIVIQISIQRVMPVIFSTALMLFLFC